jgi:Fic family protein
MFFSCILGYIGWLLSLFIGFLAIHPFQEGNGRLNRAIFLLSLLHSKSEIIFVVSRYIAIDRYVEKYKEEYYFVLNLCSEDQFKENPEDYKIQYFLKFMLKILRRLIGGIAMYRKKFQSEQKLSKQLVLF